MEEFQFLVHLYGIWGIKMSNNLLEDVFLITVKIVLTKYFDISGTSYPAAIASNDAGTAAVSRSRGWPEVLASPSKARRNSLSRDTNAARSSAPLWHTPYAYAFFIIIYISASIIEHQMESCVDSLCIRHHKGSYDLLYVTLSWNCAFIRYYQLGSAWHIDFSPHYNLGTAKPATFMHVCIWKSLTFNLLDATATVITKKLTLH